ncbi:MAG: hypothetical protein U9M95_03695 [Candidatus Altiarchaeota archaeon]|nr:hypothetical protein [Candidatus Altiarchaeota archaeon]
MLSYMIVFVVSFLTTYLTAPWIMPKLKRAGLTGKDVNKKDKPTLPEMGGFVIVFGFSAGILSSIFMYTFSQHIHTIIGVTEINNLELNLVLASLSTILIMTLIGVFDDLFAMRQSIKALLPLFAALPLVAVQAGVSTMKFPIIGSVDFGIFYALILIPIGITGASNVTNMLAGFNGLEAGMGLVASISLAYIAWNLNSPEALILLLSMSGALLAFLKYNWYPARLLMGDIGTLSIGTVIATSVIVGNFETAGVIVTIPYIIDFFIKLANRFPSDRWWGELQHGKLTCNSKPISLCQWIMKLTNGIKEQNMVKLLILIELIFGALAIVSVS